jgi:hypothetical protein
VHSKHTLHSLSACMGQDKENFREVPCLILLCPKFYAFTCYCKVSSAKRCELQAVIKVNEFPDSHLGQLRRRARMKRRGHDERHLS